MTNHTAEQILNFWFTEISPKQWFAVSVEFDSQLRERSLALLEQASAGELYTWRTTPQGRLAEVLVLDQFSRNIFRNTPRAFAQDPMALVLSQEAVAAEALPALTPVERAFLLLPWMHSESALIHAEAEQLYSLWAPPENYQYELRHKAIVDRFGRYPHRNAILGRESSAEELEFLQQPGSRF